MSRQEVKKWWADNPMTYGRTHGDAVYVDAGGEEQRVEFGSKAFFERVDKTQFDWNLPLHVDGKPFGLLFPYDSYVDQRVLEVGCGMGTMAMHWARNGARITACDLNPVAVAQTSQRFRVFDIRGRVLQADGGNLPFATARFDYAYSWGVLHHSPDLATSLSELVRVVRPGGGFGVMLYNRHSLRYLYLVKYVEGVLHGESRFLDSLELASRYSDGATEEGNPHTWPVTSGEMKELFQKFGQRVEVETFGDKELRNTLKLMMPAAWRLIPESVIRAWARRIGWSLWITGKKA